MIAVLLALAAATAPSAQPSDSFPHEAHRRLFVSCRLCHAGIVTGDSTRSRPAPGACASCHDGRIERTVDWAPREARPSNLRFDHRRHFADAPDSTADAASCQGCHASAAGAGFMAVSRARPESCISCHAHRADEHLAQSNRCATCHRPLVEAVRLAADVIARFPKPPSHDSVFTYAHARNAEEPGRCQVCHSRESCSTCHVNAAQVGPIQELGRDARVERLVHGRAVTYRAPVSHAAAGFTRSHGLQARRGAVTCANCHARESCQVCHTGAPMVPVVGSLPSRRPNGAPGVDLSALRPPGHLVGFRDNHRVVAAGGDASCSRCHRQTFCADCHDAARRPVFHAANFVARHAPAALGATNECASCHQVQVFCRDCHRQAGAGAAAPGGPAGRFHNAQANWTFGHSGAARRSLEACATCHQQNFCLRCHSASSGWKVNPHGPGFDPDIGNRNAAMCRVCHVTGPPAR